MTKNKKTISRPADAPRSWTIVHFLPGDFSGAVLNNLKPAVFPSGAFSAGNCGRPASLTSRELKAAFPFDELIISADAVFPGGGAMEAEARVKTAAGWSPWFSFGRYSANGEHRSFKSRENTFGRMDVDILRLKSPASSFRYRIKLGCGKKSPTLRLAAAAYTDSSAAYRGAEAARTRPGNRRVLTVPRCSQMAQKINRSGDMCSPVSLTMALNFHGLKATPPDTAASVLDSAENIYGNWFLNAAYAGSRGIYAFLARLNTLAEAEAFTEAGIPVIASVTFGPGELKNSPLKKTKGHLLVITGFDGKGRVVTNDPAAPDGKSVQRIYDRAQFAAAWLKNKYGTAYILAKDLNKFMAVRTRSAEFYPTPGAKTIESQLLLNEGAELLKVSGAWAKVRAAEQKALGGNGRQLAPYEGWLKLEELAFSPPLAPNAVIRTKTAGAGFSVGVKLRVTAKSPAGARVLLAGGEGAALPGRCLNPLPLKTSPARLRAGIIGTAMAFLGDKYHWGGRSARAIDCSGLVSLACRAWGLDIPRNADAQYAACARLKKNLLPADLIFSADASRPGFINHVMIYSGGGRLIEATGDTGTAREVSFEEKFGVPFLKASHGMTAGGKKIFFGRIID